MWLDTDAVWICVFGSLATVSGDLCVVVRCRMAFIASTGWSGRKSCARGCVRSNKRPQHVRSARVMQMVVVDIDSKSMHDAVFEAAEDALVVINYSAKWCT